MFLRKGKFIMAAKLNIRLSDLLKDKKLLKVIKKDEDFIFGKSEENFRLMMFEQEIPVFLCARKGGYKSYGLPVPTALWMDMFLESSGEESRILFAVLHNLIYERSLPEEFKKPLENLFLQPYQGYGLYA